MSDDDGKIIRPNFGDPKLFLDRTSGRTCMHEFVAVRTKTRSVVCRSCGEPVEPYDVLFNVARSWESCTYKREELERLQDEVDALKREEQNVKARIRQGYRSGENPKAALFFEEYMRRLNAVESRGDSYELGHWAAAFHWLTPEQESAIKEAEIRANRRIEDTERKTSKRRRRHVRVIDGGEQSSS